MIRAVQTRGLRWSRLSGWPTEIALFGLALLAYQGARAVTRGTTSDALANAHRVFDLETVLGIDVEARLQGALLGTPWLSALDWVYLLAQQAILAVGIVFVYRASRPVYRTLRTTLLTTWMLTLPIYALFPTAPPRLSGLGLLDTVSANTPIALGSGSATMFYNPYAAVPSLHAGFAVALGHRRRAQRAVAPAAAGGHRLGPAGDRLDVRHRQPLRGRCARRRRDHRHRVRHRAPDRPGAALDDGAGTPRPRRSPPRPSRGPRRPRASVARAIAPPAAGPRLGARAAGPAMAGRRFRA